MNIYLIQDDGQQYCVKAETAQAAIEAACYHFIGSLSKEERAEDEAKYSESAAAWWQRTRFESCQLIGELVNDTPITWQGVNTTVHAVARIETRVRQFRESAWREITFIDAEGNTLYEVLAHPADDDPVPGIEEVER